MDNPTLADLLKTLTPAQLDFVQARLLYQTDAAAAEQAKIHPSTVSKWPNLEDVRMCISLAKQDGVILAGEKLRRLAAIAVDVLEDELQAKRGGNKRLDAAIEILNRTIGKPTDKQEISGPGGTPLKAYMVVSPDDWPQASE